MKVKFIGATESVTGSKHLLITEKGSQILLDCGLFQGMGKETDEMNRKLDINPSSIEAVILSHAHVDHSGNLPTLVKQGFGGKIYCTPATLDVCRILLLDSAHIHQGDIAFINKRRRKKGMPLIKPLYTIEDVEKCLTLFKIVPFNQEFKINEEISFHFSENGHIIGSATVNITAHENNKKTRLAFSGDVGRYKDQILRAPSAFKQCDYIICEATYGNRLHETLIDAGNKLLDIVKKTCVEKKGRLIIPAFSLGRTQEILYSLDKLKGKGLLPDIKIFVDSPLSSAATGVVRKHPEAFNEALREYMTKDPDPFGFDHTKFITDVNESKALNLIEEPCIIISASGMCDAGRVKHHLRHNISDKKNTVLIIGYCAPGTLGAKLLGGEKQVSIFGDLFEVNAEIDSLLSYSAHADYKELLKFLSCQDKKQVKTIFLVHGEDEAKQEFREKLLLEGFSHVVIPNKGDVFPLD